MVSTIAPSQYYSYLLQGTLHRTSLDPQPDAAVKRGEHRKAPLASRFTAPATADAVETPGTEG